ncbi:TolB family protein [Muriicola sp. Z0-33]|uniref:TolB family protein n=1 Tax=Muriicola sp. Z0-33 TaxID=2816957 RepID=UPI0022375C50|nr:hypothetical protein [Muriicola sp. Z0-33]MCW5517321.1 PD40 domain-containing protein [Muriicola sp. Z0-33]
MDIVKERILFLLVLFFSSGFGASVWAQRADHLDFGPRLSPDFSKVVYYSYRNDSLPDLYLMDLKFCKEIQLTYDYKAWDLNPKWSVDGKHIYFSSDRNGDMAIYRMELKTSKIKQVTYPRKGYRHSEISFTADGKKMAYCEFQPNNRTAIYLRTLENYKDTLLLRSSDINDEFFKPVIHPDGNELVFLKNVAEESKPLFDIFLLDILKGSIKNITRTPEINERMPSWSNDGDYLIYSADQNQMSFDLFKREWHSKSVVQISFNDDRQELNSHLSAKILLYDSGFYGMEKEGNTYIYLADAEGKNVRQLTN